MPNKTRRDSRDYAVGYGKPPAARKFKPGVSGNPRGRPKGSPNLATVLRRALNEKVVINEGGRRKSVSKLEAASKQVANKAALGDLNAIKLLASLPPPEESQGSKDASRHSLGEMDQKVLEGFLERIG